MEDEGYLFEKAIAASKKDLWEQIQTGAAGINKDSIKQLTNSMDSRLLKVVTAKGGYIHY